MSDAEWTISLDVTTEEETLTKIREAIVPALSKEELTKSFKSANLARHTRGECPRFKGVNNQSVNNGIQTVERLSKKINRY